MRNKTKVISSDEARGVITAGVHLIADAVESTMGPRSGFVGIARQTQDGQVYERTILKDGVSVGKAVDLADEAVNFSARVLLEAAQKTVDMVGDGTTVTIALARALYDEGLSRIHDGTEPMAIRQEVEADLTTAEKLIHSLSTPITTLAQTVQIATISCEEEDLGALIGKTIHDIGQQGVVTVEHSKTGETYCDMQQGMQWDRGLASPYFITDPETRTGTIEEAAILITDYEITNILELRSFLDEYITKSRFLVIIAPDFTGDGLSSLVANRVQNILQTLCIKAPGFGRQQTDMLEDIAILTGGTFISQAKGHLLKDVRPSHLGHADRVSAGQTTALISGGEGDSTAIAQRVTEIEAQLSQETNDFERERLKERLAKLTKGVAVIKVGGATDIEIKERYERALDATLATRQAVKHGIVPGGQTIYLTLIPQMQSPLVKKALERPFQILCENAGLNAGQMRERLHIHAGKSGIDVTDGKVKEMKAAGIIDPTSVPLEALKNAASVALTLLATKTIIIPDYEVPEVSKK